MDFVDRIKISRVNNVVLVSSSSSSTTHQAAGDDEEIAATPASNAPNDLQAWSGNRLEGTLVITSHHLLLSSSDEEVWVLHSNIDTVDVQGPGLAGSGNSSGAGPSTPTQTRVSSAASRIGAMASAVANQYNLAVGGGSSSNSNNGNVASINGETGVPSPFDASLAAAMDGVNAVSLVTVPNYHVLVRCKSLQRLRLSFKNLGEAQKVFESLKLLSNLPSTYTQLLYPFFYRSSLESAEDGWGMFELESEFNRLVLSLSDAWRLSRVNRSFDVTPTYPSLVLVPKVIDDDAILKIAKFRQAGRFPVLSYFHKQTQMVILRSGQPLTGPNVSRRCKEDERFLNATLPRNSRRGYVVDTRSQAAVKAAQAKGGGIEPEAHYPQWKKIHCGLERPQATSESYSKMVEACADSNASATTYMARVNDSGWLGHVRDLLHAACLVAQCVAQEDACVLVHGTEGLDTTLQVTSLAQILLNQDARTLRGFQALITREWLAFGHPFRDRHCRGPFAAAAQSVPGGSGEAPTFLLFLDCVHQIHRHHPCAFEFTEDFLIEIFEHAYSSKFGTFLSNHEKDRADNGFSTRTVSLWTYVNHKTVLPQFINPLYEPNPDVIWASVAPQSLRVWDALFARWQLNLKPHHDAWQEIKAMKEKEQEERAEVLRLRKELAELEKEAMELGLLDAGFPSAAAAFEQFNPVPA